MRYNIINKGVIIKMKRKTKYGISIMTGGELKWS